MKISKVNHVRAGVGRKETNNVGGVIYHAPVKNEKFVAVEKHIGKLFKNAIGLYKPFNQIQEPVRKDKMKDEEWESRLREYKIAKAVSDTGNLEWLFYKQPPNNVAGCLAEKRRKLYFDYSVLKKYKVDYQGLLAVCRRRLRKSLSRSVNCRNTKMRCDVPELYARLFAEKMKMVKVRALTDEEFLSLWWIVYEDRSKSKQRKDLQTAIEGNNVRVQVDNTGPLPLLTLASSVKQEKKSRKEYHVDKSIVFDYMKRFASLDKQGKDEEIKAVRCLAVLFVCGAERYELAKNADDMTACRWGRWLPSRDEVFNKAAFDFWKEADEARYKAKDSRLSASKLFEMRRELNQSGIDFFRKAALIAKEEFSAEVYKEKLFWLKFFQNVMEKQFRKDNYISKARFSSARLCQVLFREWNSYIASKFVDIGKGVYHFAMPAKYDFDKELELGRVAERYVSGITSFDYEFIKAEETIKRDMAVSVVYAAAVFSYNALNPSAVKCKNKEDVLLYSNGDLAEHSREDAVRRVLQFFGGKSRWEDMPEYENWIADRVAFLDGLKQALRAVRNSNFHYSADPYPIKESAAKLIRTCFRKEYACLKNIYSEKYYSNNVPMFYDKQNIEKLLTTLYHSEAVAEAQIPAFSRVFPRGNFGNLKGSECLNIASKLARFNADDKLVEKYRSAEYFLLKEIYYRGFLFDEDLGGKLIRKVKDQFEHQLEPEEQYKFRSFRRRICELPQRYSFAQICQQIMTDINMQNQGQKNVRTFDQKNTARENNHKEKYAHFSIFLYRVIRMLFVDYLKKNKQYDFLFEPVDNFAVPEKIANQDFCNSLSWECGCFSGLNELMNKNETLLLAWYVAGHFLPAKQLNELKGNVKSYLQYVKSIRMRAEGIGNYSGEDNEWKEKNAIYGNILMVLDFVSCFNGRVSNSVDDYFSGEADYCRHLNEFFVQEVGKNIEGPGKEFFDEVNPIINRGVAFSAMYGLDAVLQNIGYKVSEEEYQDYTKKAQDEKVKYLFECGRCKSKGEKDNVVKYQQSKNRIKLNDLMQYAEMLMDHLGQLVSFAYFRERDLMYFQMGMHYLRLYHCNGLIPADDNQRRLSCGNISISDGALLYEIVASYDYNLPFIRKNKDGKLEKANEGLFFGMYGLDVYSDGLQLFEKLTPDENKKDEHVRAHDLRNDIAHLKYLGGCGRSIMDFYSSVYNGFFRYDTKLKKSVSYLFKNIMMRYFLEVKLSFKEDAKGYRQIIVKDIQSAKGLFTLYDDGDNNGNNKKKKCSLDMKSGKFKEIAENLLNWSGR